MSVEQSPGPHSSLVTGHSSLNIALFAGEYSGDVQGAALAAALRERWACLAETAPADPNTQHPTPNTLSLWGIGGGPAGRRAGVSGRRPPPCRATGAHGRPARRHRPRWGPPPANPPVRSPLPHL